MAKKTVKQADPENNPRGGGVPGMLRNWDRIGKLRRQEDLNRREEAEAVQAHSYRIEVSQCETGEFGAGSERLVPGYRAVLWAEDVHGVSRIEAYHEWRQDQDLHKIGAKTVAQFRWAQIEKTCGPHVPVIYGWEVAGE